MMKIKCKRVSRGIAKGAALVSEEPLSFLGGVDPATGIVIEKGHPLEGKSVSGKVLIFPKGKGSTVGAYIIYGLKRRGLEPAAIININADPMVASGAVIAGIPMVHRLESDPYKIPPNNPVVVNADEEYVEVL